MNIAYNMDCMEYLKTVPDKYFDLAVVDPPYGGGADVDAFENKEKGAHFVGRGRSKKYAELHGGANFERRKRSRFGCWFDRYHIGESFRHTGEQEDREICEVPTPTTDGLVAPEIKATRTGAGHNKYGKDNSIRHWDIAPPQEYFNELARVSKNQIIWGGNYFALPPTRCFLVWRKLTISENFSMAMAEYAWTSFNENAKVFEAAPQGKDRFHPTQKPVALYEWIYRLFAKQGDKILDTHLGSGSSRIAAYNAGLDFVGCEIDEFYFAEQEKRFNEHIKQPSIFTMQEEYLQGDLFGNNK